MTAAQTPGWTPGPWETDYDNADERSGGQWFTVGPARVWFSYSVSDAEFERAKADARLIAAAPMPVEALQELLDATQLRALRDRRPRSRSVTARRARCLHQSPRRARSSGGDVMGDVKPKQRVWDAGTDAYGRSVTLISDRTYDGKQIWVIQSHAANQRDEGEKIYGLSLASMRQIASIIAKETP